MGTSSDFGNLISTSIASIVLPFLPMLPVQVLLMDILYDVSQLSIPSDNVDADQLKAPKSWDIKYIRKFMIFFGPIGAAYDLATFAVMYFYLGARGGIFQTGAFIENLVTEVLVVFVIRTRKVPFFKSRPSLALASTCLGVTAFGVYLPFSPVAQYLDFKMLPPMFFVFLAILTLTYLVFVEIGKYYLNKHNETGSAKS